MDILPQNFKTLRLCGLWNHNEKFSITFFIYKICVLLLVTHISLGQLLYVFVTSKNVKELTTGLVFTVKFIELCVKLLNFLSKKDEMEQLLTIFREDICQAKLSEEVLIVNSYKTKNRTFFWVFLIVSECMTTMHMIQCVFNWAESMELPFQIYDPLHTTDFTIMSLFYAMEVVECSYSVCLNVCFDTMVYGFINLTCGLYEMLCFRIQRSANRNAKLPMTVKECVKLHIVILKILDNIKTFFMGAITIMFVFTLSVICSGIFAITEKSSTLDADKIILLYYIVCIIAQSYMYCWYGTELEEKMKKVAVVAYEIDWTYSTPAEVKSLTLMILIAQRGSTISYRGLCSLSNETFGWIIKSAYAALNVLKNYSNS